jgi:hypothetical protein
MPVYGCQQMLLKLDKELSAILEFLCRQAHSLTNTAYTMHVNSTLRLNDTLASTT